MIGAFVHLYHVCGVFGLLTAFLFGRLAYMGWREAGGTWATAPREWCEAIAGAVRESMRDIGRVAGWALSSFLVTPLVWSADATRPSRYPDRQIMLIGITLGGIARFLTALYWSEKNITWMQHVDNSAILMAATPALIAIVGDVHHHLTAWPRHRHRVRLLCIVALAWVLIGVMRYA